MKFKVELDIEVPNDFHYLTQEGFFHADMQDFLLDLFYDEDDVDLTIVSIEDVN